MATPVQYDPDMLYGSPYDYSAVEAAAQVHQNNRPNSEVFMERHLEYEAEIARRNARRVLEWSPVMPEPARPVTFQEDTNLRALRAAALYQPPATPKPVDLPPSVPFWNR